jgi:hypothetical protein
MLDTAMGYRDDYGWYDNESGSTDNLFGILNKYPEEGLLIKWLRVIKVLLRVSY